ncbi:MAG: hypothetical protein EA381_14530 [Planctomycetaceae bacterium]|nr:MAG: hypothetical protein EA381_14530 [Planctomycetaceae bacterium]
MNVILFDLPPEPERQAEWLERVLVSPAAGQLLSDIAALRSIADEESSVAPEASEPGLAEIIGEQQEVVLREGLRPVDRATFRRLLQSPVALSELMLEIELSDSPYWRSLTPVLAGPMPTAAERAPEAGASEVPKTGLPDSDSRANGTMRRWFVAAAALAAATLLAIANWPDTPDSGWGWDRQEVFALRSDAPTYLRHLASAADEWFQRTPATDQELRSRLVAFRRGCDKLLAAPHPSLNATDRDWLRERCQVWSEKFDDQLARLDRSDDWSVVLREADETVLKLIQALRDRADDLV